MHRTKLAINTFNRSLSLIACSFERARLLTLRIARALQIEAIINGKSFNICSN